VTGIVIIHFEGIRNELWFHSAYKLPSPNCLCSLTVTILFYISFASLPFPLAKAGHQHSYCTWERGRIHCHHIFILIGRNCDWWQADSSDCHCFLFVPGVREHDTQIIQPLPPWCVPACPLSDLCCYPVTWKAAGAGCDVLTPTWLCLSTSDPLVCSWTHTHT
jgi:hypothetical protein